MKATIVLSPSHLADLGPAAEAVLREHYNVETQELAAPAVSVSMEYGVIERFRFVVSPMLNVIDPREYDRRQAYLDGIKRAAYKAMRATAPLSASGGAQWKRELRGRKGRR